MPVFYHWIKYRFHVRMLLNKLLVLMRVWFYHYAPDSYPCFIQWYTSTGILFLNSSIGTIIIGIMSMFCVSVICCLLVVVTFKNVFLVKFSGWFFYSGHWRSGSVFEFKLSVISENGECQLTHTNSWCRNKCQIGSSSGGCRLVLLIFS